MFVLFEKSKSSICISLGIKDLQLTQLVVFSTRERHSTCIFKIRHLFFDFSIRRFSLGSSKHLHNVILEANPGTSESVQIFECINKMRANIDFTSKNINDSVAWKIINFVMVNVFSYNSVFKYIYNLIWHTFFNVWFKVVLAIVIIGSTVIIDVITTNESNTITALINVVNAIFTVMVEQSQVLGTHFTPSPAIINNIPTPVINVAPINTVNGALVAILNFVGPIVGKVLSETPTGSAVLNFFGLVAISIAFTHIVQYVTPSLANVASAVSSAYGAKSNLDWWQIWKTPISGTGIGHYLPDFCSNVPYIWPTAKTVVITYFKMPFWDASGTPDYVRIPVSSNPPSTSVPVDASASYAAEDWIGNLQRDDQELFNNAVHDWDKYPDGPVGAQVSARHSTDGTLEVFQESSPIPVLHDQVHVLKTPIDALAEVSANDYTVAILVGVVTVIIVYKLAKAFYDDYKQ